jgi:hypothetical protein
LTSDPSYRSVREKQASARKIQSQRDLAKLHMKLIDQQGADRKVFGDPVVRSALQIAAFIREEIPANFGHTFLCRADVSKSPSRLLRALERWRLLVFDAGGYAGAANHRSLQDAQQAAERWGGAPGVVAVKPARRLARLCVDSAQTAGSVCRI